MRQSVQPHCPESRGQRQWQLLLPCGRVAAELAYTWYKLAEEVSERTEITVGGQVRAGVQPGQWAERRETAWGWQALQVHAGLSVAQVSA